MYNYLPIQKREENTNIEGDPWKMKVTIRPNWGPPTLAAIATPVEQRPLLFRFKHFKRNFENSVGADGMRAKEIAYIRRYSFVYAATAVISMWQCIKLTGLRILVACS